MEKKCINIWTINLINKPTEVCWMMVVNDQLLPEYWHPSIKCITQTEELKLDIKLINEQKKWTNCILMSGKVDQKRTY